VIGLHNSAGEVFNVTHIAGSINAPQAFQYYVQNFTFQVTPCIGVCLDLARRDTVLLFPCELSLDRQGVVLCSRNSQLKPGEQASLQYTFKPDSYLPVQEWQLSLTAYLR